ncbi:transcriptional regulator Spx [Virgibacillus oceani]
MTVRLFGTPCSSTRKAKEWLDQHGISYMERNILRQPLTIGELHSILRMTLEGTDEIIATRSKVYKDLNIDLDSLPLKELLNIIQLHPSLMRSPIIIDEKRIQVGYHEDDIRQFVPRKERKNQWLQWQMNNVQIAKG